MTKTKKIFFAIFLIMAAFTVSAKEYSTHFVTYDTDLDYLKFVNHTNDDLIIRYDCGMECNYVAVKAKKEAKIEIGIEATGDNPVWIDVLVRFEVKTSDMQEKKISWTMNNKRSDINIVIEEDQGWSF